MMAASAMHAAAAGTAMAAMYFWQAAKRGQVPKVTTTTFGKRKTEKAMRSRGRGGKEGKEAEDSEEEPSLRLF